MSKPRPRVRRCPRHRGNGHNPMAGCPGRLNPAQHFRRSHIGGDQWQHIRSGAVAPREKLIASESGVGCRRVGAEIPARYRRRARHRCAHGLRPGAEVCASVPRGTAVKVTISTRPGAAARPGQAEHAWSAFTRPACPRPGPARRDHRSPLVRDSSSRRRTWSFRLGV